jgi:cytochrome c oxidase cbb3-type subunit 3
MRISSSLKAILFGSLVTIVSVSGAATVTDSRQAVEQEMVVARTLVRQMTRGSLVYKTYCVLCHGGIGDGAARIVKLHDKIDLRITKRPREYYEKIIRGGGLAVGRSGFMPTWQDELSEEQILDVAEYLNAVSDPVRRGEVVFKTNCILCHGVKGDGKGRASVLFDPPPADLTHSDKNDEYKRMIITMGGKAMGRSEVMPVWGEQLKANEIDDVVAYLRTILVVAPAN